MYIMETYVTWEATLLGNSFPPAVVVSCTPKARIMSRLLYHLWKRS